MLARTHTGSMNGVCASAVQVEVSLGRGLPGLDLVGLPEAAVREAKVRVKTAIAETGYVLPPRHIVLNLAPAELRKSGAGLDLAIAIGVLAASGACASRALDQTFLLGELGLDGELRSTRGVLAQLHAARARGFARAIVPRANEEEASLAAPMDVRCAAHLPDVVAHLAGAVELPEVRPFPARVADDGARGEDLSQVCGHEAPKRALEIAAAGGHSLLLVGPPGVGKTMLARRLPALLPTPTAEERVEIAAIAGAVGHPTASAPGAARPFRAPHHSASAAAVIGGGNPVRPGEITLAHRGVLFLDELPEFRRDVLEALRTTMERRVAIVDRAKERLEMPADALVIAAMNPCPCGHAGDRRRLCTCAPAAVARYRARVSGPLLDRFDMHVRLGRPPSLRGAAGGEPSERVRERVEAARGRARARGRAACDLAVGELHATASPEALTLLERVVERHELSARAYVKALRVARTIADLAAAERVLPEHVAEASMYRALDRERAPGEGRNPS